MALNGEILTLSIMSVLVGIFVSQLYLNLTFPDEARSGDGGITLIKTSNLVKMLNGNGVFVGTIGLGDLASSVSMAKYNKECVLLHMDYDHAARHADPLSTFSPKARHVISAGFWYGGPQYYTARWPIDKEEITCQKYVSDDLLAKPTKFGSILERYWLSSSNLAVYIPNDDEDFEYGVENGDIVFQSSSRLSYVVCSHGDSIKHTHVYMVNKFFSKPSGLPDRDMFYYPIWSTWARYKIYINESTVLSFANEIKENGFSASQIEIDDTYTTNYGDHLFDLNRFPNPANLISDLNKLGFRVTSWVHPFANFDTEAFQVFLYAV